MSRRAVITGLGVVSSIGIGWPAFWENLINGVSGISPVTSFDTSGHFTHNGGEVKGFRPEDLISGDRVPEMNRSSQMALHAAWLAVRDSRLDPASLPGRRASVSFGTTLGDVQAIEAIDDLLLKGEPVPEGLIRQIPTNAAPTHIATEFGCRGSVFMFSTACAAGNYAIAYAFDLIRLGRADIVIAGASDPMSRIEFTGFNQFSAVAPERCQPFDRNRKGMMLAEGAAVLVIEDLANALKRNAPIHAEIIGYGLSCDARHMTTPSVSGIAECMKNALKEAGITPRDVDYICAHGTGTVANDRAECAAIRELFGGLTEHIPVGSIKSMLGHTMGAASAIEAVACALTVKNDIIPPTINFETPDPECAVDCVPNRARQHTVNIALNNSYAFGGNNASLVLKKYAEQEDSVHGQRH